MRMQTAHGEVLTPAFMPVGTRAMVNYLTPEDLQQVGSQIILGGNTYHMLVSPGIEVIESLGGMHRLMHWKEPMLTDSGGFQVYSLSQNEKICRITESGARFKHPINGKVIDLTPETSLAAQKVIGADIIMAFDQCTSDTHDRAVVLAALERTQRWLVQSKAYHDKNPSSRYGYTQAFFGIIQGAYCRDLREMATEFVISQDTDGIAIGGASIGFDMKKTEDIIDWVRPALPKNKVRYTMGVGLSPQDLLDVVRCGIDIFDCVAPTRNARHGSLYCGRIERVGNWLEFVSDYKEGRLHIKHSVFKMDDGPVLPECGCYTCQHYTRGYLHYLFKEKLIAYTHLASIHNIHVMQETCLAMRKLITAEKVRENQ